MNATAAPAGSVEGPGQNMPGASAGTSTGTVAAPQATSQTPPSAPATPAAPAAPVMPLRMTLAYMGAAAVISITQGLGQGFVSSNISQIAGELGATTTEASWLLAAYLIPRASLPLLLTKVRMQYGLRQFAEVAIILYLVLAFTSLWIVDLRSAIIVQFFSGIASAPLSTLAFLYMIEPLAPRWKMRMGMPMVMALTMMGPSLARVISPSLFGDGGWSSVHLMVLGLAAISLALVFLLKLKPAPRVKALALADIVSWLLIATGFGGLTVAAVMGATYWWTDTSWIGWVLVLGIVCLCIAVVIELNRTSPLLDIRWLASPAIVHLTITLLIFRLILSEQSAGAPRMFQVLGVTQNQLVPLFAVICVAGILGGLACIPFMTLKRVPHYHVVALVMIALGAWLDSHSTTDTRPEQMIVSQALIAFAGTIFIGPALLRGLTAALARGPNYILSFFVVFLSTQSVGGSIGSGMFSTLINHRQAFHMQVLQEELQATSPITMAAIAARTAGLASQISDPSQRQAQAVSLIATETSNQAYVMAYNDAYFLTFLLAVAALFALLLHMGRDWVIAKYEQKFPSPEPPKASADPEVSSSRPSSVPETAK
ncbi:MFS transporter [Paracoccus sp. (in: a-proteobacteria)]|uniref:MFS transporter n=1 Tax=Paracoccus sp. TaxID=267 RepID=UPI00289E33F7|nr:MFS transporter [Paracoccus sp. (in: a-proteobacteria)]